MSSGDSERRPRSLQTIALTAGTVIAGIGALVLLGYELVESNSSLLDILLWCALVVLLFGSAAHRWWFAGRAADRSRDIVEDVSAAEVEEIAQESTGEVDLVRRLRVAHPGLSLRDAHQLMLAYKERQAGRSA